MEVHTHQLVPQVDIDHKLFVKDTVWGQAIRRFAELCLVQLAKYRHASARASARGTHEPTAKYNNEMQPLAFVKSDGTLQFSPKFTQELKEANGLSYIQQTSSPGRRKYIFSRAHWRRRVTGKCLRPVTTRTVALFRIFVKSSCRLRRRRRCLHPASGAPDVENLCSRGRNSPSQPYVDWLCPLHADSRPIQSLGGFLRPTATQTFPSSQ